MRIKLKTKPRKGEKRFVDKFLFFPLKIGDEIRWLEFSKIEQIGVEKRYYDVYLDVHSYYVKWMNIRFVDYEPKWNEHKTSSGSD